VVRKSIAGLGILLLILALGSLSGWWSLHPRLAPTQEEHTATLAAAVTPPTVAVSNPSPTPLPEPSPSARSATKPLPRAHRQLPATAKRPPFVPPPPQTSKEIVLHTLGEAATTYEATSLPVIEPHLYSPDPEIRGAALNAVVILGDKAGAPLLRKAALSATNSAEAAELMDQAAYLELPPARLHLIKRPTQKK